MVKRIIGLKRGPRVPPIFGGESRQCAAPILPRDEIRCAKGDQEIYVGVLGISSDGLLLGSVVAFGELKGYNSFGVVLGDLVEIGVDRVLAILPGIPPEISEGAATPAFAMAHG
jgi:hypothetical protein